VVAPPQLEPAPAVQPRTFPDKVDRWVTAPVLGPVIFLAVMWLVFQITTAVAAPLQDFLDGLFSGPVSAGATWLLAQLGLAFALVPDQLELIVRSPLRLGAAVCGLALVAALAVAFVRFPAAVPVALLAVAPIRIPITLENDEAFLLLLNHGTGYRQSTVKTLARTPCAWQPGQELTAEVEVVGPRIRAKLSNGVTLAAEDFHAIGFKGAADFGDG